MSRICSSDDVFEPSVHFLEAIQPPELRNLAAAMLRAPVVKSDVEIRVYGTAA